MLGAAAGVRVTICLPGNASPERWALLKVYGAEVVVTDRMDGTEGAARRARELAEESPDKYFYADQYSNPANPRAHRETTGPEIWAQTGGRLTHFVAAMGTTGTMMGTGRFLKEKNPAITLVGVQPDSPFHGLEGLEAPADHGAPARALRSGGARQGGRDPDRDRRPDRALAGARIRAAGRLVGRARRWPRRWTCWAASPTPRWS